MLGDAVSCIVRQVRGLAMKTTQSALAIVFTLSLVLAVGTATGADSVDAQLAQQIARAPLERTSVVITWDHQPGAAELSALRLLGIAGGIALQ